MFSFSACYGVEGDVPCPATTRSVSEGTAPCVMLVGSAWAVTSPGLGGGRRQGGNSALYEIVHEECDITGSSAERLDANGDGRADITIVREDGRRRACRAADINFDGASSTPGPTSTGQASSGVASTTSTATGRSTKSRRFARA